MYTYLIGWRKLDKWYYGVRLSYVDKPENDLWMKYKTSSKYVSAVVEQHGPPDVVKVHKIFTDKQSAIDYEIKFLKRVSAKNSDRWINRNDSPAPPVLMGEKNGFFNKTHTEQQKLKWSKERKGRKLDENVKLKLRNRIPWNKNKKRCFSDETLKKMSDAKKGKLSWNSGKKNVFSDETLKKMSDAKRGKKVGPCSDEKKTKISTQRKGKKWYKNVESTKCVCCYPEQQPIGWIEGMVKKSKELYNE